MTGCRKIVLSGILSAYLVSSSIAFSPPSQFTSSTKALSARQLSINNNLYSKSSFKSAHLNSLDRGATTFKSGASAKESKKSNASSTARFSGSLSNFDNIPLFEKFLVGIKRDYKLRLPFYGSDITDGFKIQCFAATAFLFFACLAPAIGFGTLFGAVTNGAIGTIEMVSSTAICGMIYALTSAQPLTIIGSTGPVLAFVATLVKFSGAMNIPFLPLYAWTGLWTSAILLVCSLFSGSNGVKYLTRFTDEIFSTLISLIFVVEAATDIANSFGTSTLAKALLTLVCATTTFSIATLLKGLRNSSYFTRRMRKHISNFAPTIGVVTGSLIARWARIAYGTATAALPALTMPATFATTSGRPWLVPIFDLPVWGRWFAFFPALMATVLLYLDQNITVRLVNNPAYKLKKGRRPKNMLDGMNADLFVISVLTAFQSIIGFPWLVAATVRSISHVRALNKIDKDGNIKGTVEQRMTGFSIHGLIACCVLFAGPRNILTNIPKSVLMGLFMYLGTSALPGNEMWERMKGFFKETSIARKQKWSSIPKRVVNGFTFLQVGCLASMYLIKNSRLGVLFPVVIAMLAPLRFSLEKLGLVSKEEMDLLDADD